MGNRSPELSHLANRNFILLNQHSCPLPPAPGWLLFSFSFMDFTPLVKIPHKVESHSVFLWLAYVTGCNVLKAHLYCSAYFLPFPGRILFQWKYQPHLSIHQPSVEPGCFHLVGIVNMNTYNFGTLVFFGYIPKSAIDGSHGCPVFRFFEAQQCFPQ